MTFPGDTRRARIGIVPLTIDGPVLVHVRRGGDGCLHCGGPAFVQLDVTRGGYSCGTVTDCAPTCSRIVCPHGVRWDSESEQCEACERAEREADAANREDDEP